MNTTNGQNDALRDNWYFVSALGIVTLCASERDARDGAAEADRDWPHHAPHIPTQLTALAASPAPVGEVVAEIGECAELKWLQGGPCQLPPGTKLHATPQERQEAQGAER